MQHYGRFTVTLHRGPPSRRGNARHFDLLILAAGRGGLLEAPRINGTVNRICSARAAADAPPERFRRIRYAVCRRFYAFPVPGAAKAGECGEIAGRHCPGPSRRRGRPALATAFFTMRDAPPATAPAHRNPVENTGPCTARARQRYNTAAGSDQLMRHESVAGGVPLPAGRRDSPGRMQP